MARWKYDLKTMGKNLRDYINEGDASKDNCTQIIDQVIVCCKWLQKKLTADDKDDYEWELEDIILDCEDTKSYLDDFDYESNEDNINDVLETFYDLMDSMRVWVAM